MCVRWHPVLLQKKKKGEGTQESPTQPRAVDSSAATGGQRRADRRSPRVQVTARGASQRFPCFCRPAHNLSIDILWRLSCGRTCDRCWTHALECGRCWLCRNVVSLRRPSSAAPCPSTPPSLWCSKAILRGTVMCVSSACLHYRRRCVLAACGRVTHLFSRRYRTRR